MPRSVEEQLSLIRRGTEAVVPEEELVEKLRRSASTGQPLRVKYGIDPTGIDVHLGHTVPLRKLRQFQELGHVAVLIIGDATALVGDPSGRDETRAALRPEQIEQNARLYLEQIGRVVDLDRAEVYYNSHWFARMGFQEVLELCRHMTVGQLLQREDFQKRLRAESPIYLHECLYPLMQGWDSVQVRADVELGGSEQLFSLMVGRELQKDAGQEPQVAITMPILVGIDGVRRMGKSLGNYIGIAEPPEQMYGKLMSIPDSAMRAYFELLTDWPLEHIEQLLAGHAREAKAALAGQIVSQFHGPAAATLAAAEFERRFRHRQDPSQIPEKTIPASELQDGRIWICRLMVLAGLCQSNSEARRLIQQGGVTIGQEQERLTDPHAKVTIHDRLILRVGRRKVVRVRPG